MEEKTLPSYKGFIEVAAWTRKDEKTGETFLSCKLNNNFWLRKYKKPEPKIQEEQIL